MDKLDKRLRRLLLEPLLRRPQNSDRAITADVLRKLDERVVGEEALRLALDDAAGVRTSTGGGHWKDPEAAARMIALTKALFASRRISMQEYVFYAAHSVEGVHEGRWLDGFYDDELALNVKAADQFQPEETSSDGNLPNRRNAPAPGGFSNKRYSMILDAKLISTYREFGLHDLVALRETDPERYDSMRERGRRSVFHGQEHIECVRDVVLQCEEEARLAASAKAYSAAVTSLGVGLEGLLLLRCLNSPRKARRVYMKLPRRFRRDVQDDPNTWTFEALIEVCGKAGWLRPIETAVARYDVQALAHMLRHIRNYVHPAKRARERPWIKTDEREYRDVLDVYEVLLGSIGRVRRTRLLPTDLTVYSSQAMSIE